MSGEPFADGTRGASPHSSDMHELGPVIVAWIIATGPLVWSFLWIAVSCFFRGGK